MANKPNAKGRPSIYSDALADKICHRLENGEALYQICQDTDMPSHSVVRQWIKEKAEFSDKYAISKREMLEREAENLIAIADSDEDPQRLRVRIDTRKWLLSKLIPKKYGDKIEHQHGELNVTVTIGGDA
jgi:hypothetical protein